MRAPASWKVQFPSISAGWEFLFWNMIGVAPVSRSRLEPGMAGYLSKY